MIGKLARALAVVAVLAGCSDDTSGDGSTTQSTTSASTGAGASSMGGNGSGATGGGGGGGGDPTPRGSCIKPGDKGNANGVGEYCTPGGGECSDFPLAGLCLADVGQDQWFCTRIGCDAMTDCGDGAGCLITGQGSACVPCKCDPSTPGCGGAGGAGGSSGGGGGAGGN